MINGWKLQSPTVRSWTSNLSAGRHSIKIEYFENTGRAVLKLGWTMPEGTKTYPIRALLKKKEPKVSEWATNVIYVL